VALLASLKNLHDFQARQGGFEAGVFEFVDVAHGRVLPRGGYRYNGSIITL
jgi:hypothetical protein